MNTTLHIPVNKSIKLKAQKMAKKQGYSSLQEVLRIFITKFAKGELKTDIIPSEEEIEYISPELEEELLKRSKELQNAIKEGTAYIAESADEMINILHNTKLD